MTEIHGRNHAPKFWEKSCQTTVPMPVPHSTRHSSNVTCNVEGDSDPAVFVVFCIAFCCASSLVPHALRLAA